MQLENYIKEIYQIIPRDLKEPWKVTYKIIEIICKLIENLDDSFVIQDDIAIHKSATVEQNVVLRGPLVISKNCVVKSGAYLREGVFLAEGVVIGPNCEIKASLVFSGSRVAHLNYVGNSIIGSRVNIEAGAILANHFNEKIDSERIVKVVVESEVIDTGCVKFGSLVGDDTRIGANAVLNPGTILRAKTIVGRLKLVDQQLCFENV